jgi:hypothetical protein
MLVFRSIRGLPTTDATPLPLSALHTLQNFDKCLREEIGRDGTVQISTVTHCFNWIYNPYSRLYTVIYTDILILLEMDDETMTLGLGIDVEIDEESLASLGE